LHFKLLLLGKMATLNFSDIPRSKTRRTVQYNRPKVSWRAAPPLEEGETSVLESRFNMQASLLQAEKILQRQARKRILRSGYVKGSNKRQQTKRMS